jgi:hypothetical protein
LPTAQPGDAFVFIHITRDFGVALEEPQDFKRFKLVIDAARSETTKLTAALDGIATLSAEGHAWVSEAWLRRRDPAASWQEGLTAMIAVAKKYGWVDEPAKTIRAHVEWSGDSPAKA